MLAYPFKVGVVGGQICQATDQALQASQVVGVYQMPTSSGKHRQEDHDITLVQQQLYVLHSTVAYGVPELLDWDLMMQVTVQLLPRTVCTWSLGHARQ